MAVTGGFCPLPLRLGGDALTGWTVEQHARMAADMVAVKRTARLCTFSWTLNGSALSVTTYTGMNGAGLAFAPTILSYASNVLSFRWPTARFADSYQVACGFVPRHGVVSVQKATFARAVHTLLNDGIQFIVFDSAGSPLASPLSGTCDLW